MEDHYDPLAAYIGAGRDLIDRTISRILTPIRSTIRTATSKTAQRTYITFLLILLAASILLFTAIIAYITFYYSYIPTRGFSRPIHLQFEPGPHALLVHTPTGPAPVPNTRVAHPHGEADVSGMLVAQQRYDVRVELHMPRTPTNLRAGNFMVDVALRAPGLATPVRNVINQVADAVGEEGVDDVVVRESRSAILEYRSWVMEVRERVVWGLWYVAGWRREDERLSVGVMEGVVFEKGWRNVPNRVRVEVRGREVLQVYACEVVFRARLQGLRYIMHNHRIASFIIFTTLFYAIEVISLLATWTLLSIFLFPTKPTITIKSDPTIKPDPEDSDSDSDSTSALSTTSRSFPTYSRHQKPLHYSSPDPIKNEPLDDDESELSGLPLAPGEAADDEDEEADDFVLGEDEHLRRIAADSGLGTSLESSGGRRDEDKVRRRRSGGMR